MFEELPLIVDIYISTHRAMDCRDVQPSSKVTLTLGALTSECGLRELAVPGATITVEASGFAERTDIP